jgi:hypothetical protein
MIYANVFPFVRGRQRTTFTRLISSIQSLERHISVDGAPVNSNIWKSRYQPNVQLPMLYLTNETGPQKLFKRPSYLSLDATFSSFSLPPPHLEPEMEMTQVDFFLSSLVFLITGWMEHIMRPTRSYSFINSGRDPQTLQTHRQR